MATVWCAKFVGSAEVSTNVKSSLKLSVALCLRELLLARHHPCPCERALLSAASKVEPARPLCPLDQFEW